MKPLNRILITFVLAALLSSAPAREAAIAVQANHFLHPVSRYLTGACLEDVNHEVYGGLYSQMIFGESFQEPAPTPALKNFTTYGGHWTPSGSNVTEAGGTGPKLIAHIPPFSDGETSVELMFSTAGAGNAGLLLKVSQADTGADQFNGYEISLEPSGAVVLGVHQHDWRELRKVPCNVPVKEWLKLTARLKGNSIEVLVNNTSVLKYEDNDHSLDAGGVGLRTWQHEAGFRNFSVDAGNGLRTVSFALQDGATRENGVSGMWRAVQRGTATGEFSLESSNAFVGNQSQVLRFTGGEGEIGIENRGLNRWGMNFVANNEYDGAVDVRSDAPTPVMLSLESADGSVVYARTNLLVTNNNWQHLTFSLTPSDNDTNGRLAITLAQPGSVAVGYSFLEPGNWGRFRGLPVRGDVTKQLIAQGITALRYGGSMVNAPGYRWKKMVGPRNQRPPYAGTWYAYSSDGWGIPDFLNFCDAAGFLGIPDFNINETAQDMVDFVQYANGSTNSKWGALRAADGHRLPYGLKYLELGNEERVDDTYYQKFQALAKAIWAADANMIIVVGDFSYHQVISNSLSFAGADSGITNLSGQGQILRLARQYNREVWFDLHVWTEGPAPDSSLAGMFSYDDALGKLALGAKYKVVVFELNANNHSQRRALANALAITAAERDGRIPIVTSANCLQPDGENDNGWDQGLLFLNASQVWLQPPGEVSQMISDNYQPMLVECQPNTAAKDLAVSAKASKDGKTLVLDVVNPGAKSIFTMIVIRGNSPTRWATADVMAGGLDGRNSAFAPNQIQPIRHEWRPNFKNGKTHFDFPPQSFTTLKFSK